MIEVAVSEEALDAVDVGKNAVRVRVRDWEPGPAGPGLDRRVDRTLTGATSGLSVPETAVSIERADAHQWRTFDPGDPPTELPAGEHVLKFELDVVVYVAVRAAGRLSQSTRDGTVRLDLDQPSPVTVGFRSRIEQPRETVSVPPTPSGALTAVRWLASAIDADTPDKSYPTKRAHPPAIAFGETVDVPPAVRDATTTSDVTVSVPESLEAVLVTAPLSYYLQADLRGTSEGPVRVEAPPLEGPLRLGESAPLEQDVAALLGRVFHLDCLVRNAGPYGVDLREFGLLEVLDLDADDLYRRSDAERLAAYLRADYSRVAGQLPDWHLSTVLAPTFRSVRALPYLLDRLSLVQVPDPVGVSRGTLVSESVPESYARDQRQWDGSPAGDLVRNRTRLGALQGWMADGTAADAFRATLPAFEHRFRYHDPDGGPRTVVVVINEESMLVERDAVERIYRDRSEALSLDLTVAESLDIDALRGVLASRVDFLHFIGHCDESGLRCRDGSLSTASLESTGVETFFLNACGSFDQGLELVRRGSVAGAVTLANVLNPEASEVGMTFARLVMHGFSMSRALELASRKSLTSRFYAVVGDGLHRLSQGQDTFPAELSARQRSATRYEVQFAFPQLTIPGGLARPRLPPDADYVLRGCRSSVTVGRREFVDFLASVTAPVIYEDSFYWSTELADDLADRVASGPPLDGPD